MTHLSERELSLPTLEFPKIFKRVVNDKSVISLGPGEPDFETPSPLVNYAKKVLASSGHYSEPQGMLELREAIVKKLRKENHIRTNAENIIVTCGSQEALFASLLTALDPGEEIIVPSPGYVGYLPAIDLVNAVPVFLKLDQRNNFEVDPERLRKLINKKKTKAIIINSPSNPTGNVLSLYTLKEIAKIAKENDLYIFSDEAYEKIIYNKKHISIASLPGMEKYAVTFHTFSKSYAMCGFRLGYVTGPKKFIQEMIKVHHYITLTAPHISQLMGIKALTSNMNPYVSSMVKEYTRRRNFIVKKLNELGMPTTLPDGAFYTFSNISRYSDSSSKFAKTLLDTAKVAVIPGTEFGPAGEGFIRCNFATKYEKIVDAMNRIEKVLT